MFSTSISCIHEIYYLVKYGLTPKYARVRNGLWTLLLGLVAAAGSTVIHQFM